MLDVNRVVSGTQYRGQLEEKVQKLAQELTNYRHTILFLDNAHLAFGNNGASNLMSLLKPYLAESKITCICITSNEEYQKTFSKDKSLCKLFQKIHLQTMEERLLMEVLKISSEDLEKYHGVKYNRDVIHKSISLAKRYFPERKLPDSAIDLLDEAASTVSSKKKKDILPIKNIIEEIEEIDYKIKFYISAEKYEHLLDLKKEYNKLNTLLRQHKKQSSQNNIVDVEVSDLRTVISYYGIEDKKFVKKINSLKADLKNNMYGQENALDKILKVLRRNIYGLGSEKRPIASFLFCGPSGVGKTQLAKIMAKHLYSEDQIVRLDMSEYSEKFTVSQLIGAPPGYIGYSQGGKLTEAIKRNPHSLILFDEVEKAHQDIYNLLLQVLDEGHMTDSTGQKIDFKNCIIVMTSNLGNNLPSSVGFGNQIDTVKNSAEKAISKFFRIEFLNRIDDVVYFEPLTTDAFYEIMKKEVNEIQTKLSNKDIKMLIDQSAFDALLELGVSVKHGARYLKRTIYEKIVDPMLLKMEELDFHGKKNVQITFEKDFNFEII